MTTALNVYGTNAASTTLSTAGLLVSVTGASGNGQSTTKCGTSTGFSEMYALGTANAWQAAGSLAAVTPSGNGWLYDTTALENQQLAAGTYTPAIRAKISVGTATADMYVNVYKVASDLVTYTLIGTCSLLAQSLSTTIANYTFAGNSLPSMTFGTGDKLYYHVVFNLSVNGSGSSTATIAFTNANSATQGRAANAELDTPGYNPVATSNIQVTDAGVNLWRNADRGADNSLITYVALGTSNTAPAASDTKLGNEVFRKAVTSYTNGLTGEILVTGYFSSTDAVGVNIAEIGFFGGANASSAANSGTLIAHGLYTLNNKTNLQSLQAVLDLTYLHL
jgi:hypothetical protein